MAGATVERDRTATFRSALRWTLVLTGVAFVVLLVTGLYLMWFYRPNEELGWINVTGSPPDTLPDTMRDIHQVASLLFVALALVAAVMAVVLAVQLRKVVAAVVGCVFFLFAFNAPVTGSLLAWDQVALRAVTVGTSYQGFWKINSGNVRYVLVDGHEISSEPFMRWFWVHTTVLPIALIGLAVLLLLTTRARPTDQPRVES
jgi:quinol-cytochrome oxidoreductase complex cytochrome b subunit